MVNRGEVRWADLGAKRRPVVLLTRQSVIGRLTSVVVAPCTTTVRNLPTEVRLASADGLPKKCVVNLDNVSLVETGALGGLVTSLTEDRMREVCAALNLALGCDR